MGYENLLINERMREIVKFSLRKMKSKSFDTLRDVKNAFDLFFEKNAQKLDDDRTKETLEKVYVLCRYLEPNGSHVIAMLLFPGLLSGTVKELDFRKAFNENNYREYYSYAGNACKTAKLCEGKDEFWSIAYHIMMNVCDSMSRDVKRLLNQRKASNAIFVSQAYELAKDCHSDDTRETGEPYVARRIRVAKILADMGAESNILTVALLQDVKKKAKCTHKVIRDKCGEAFARYVDALTSWDEKTPDLTKSDEQYFSALESDEKSFERLLRDIGADNQMLHSLYVRAGEIIDDLQTIDALPSKEKLDGDDKARRVYLKIFSKLKFNTIVDTIEDLMWRTRDFGRYEKVKEKYADFIWRNRGAIEETVKKLTDIIPSEINSILRFAGSSGFDVEICRRDYRPKEVNDFILKDHPTCKDPWNMVSKQYIPSCDIDIILDPIESDTTKRQFVTAFPRAFENRMAVTGRAISDFYEGKDGSFIFEIVDHNRNTYRCHITMRQENDSMRNGPEFHKISESLNEADSAEEKINVFLRNGKMITLPKGSCVLDAAFEVHEEVAFAATSALVNGVPVSIYNVLSNGDEVIVVADTERKDGVTTWFVSHARISWLNNIKSDKAREKLISYLSYIHDGDDPGAEHEAKDSAVEQAADAILRELRS